MTALLDHVALRASDRPALRDALLRALEWRVIEETERFTLLGPHPDFGKLTLLDAEPGTRPVPTRLQSIVVAVAAGDRVDAPLQLPEGLSITFGHVDSAASESIPRHAVIGATLRAQDPPIAAALLEAEHDMRVELVQPQLAVLHVHEDAASGTLTLIRERWDTDETPMLDHVGVRIDDAEQQRRAIEQDGRELVRWVEAPHSKAAFVAGPEGLLLEYVELTTAFAT